MLINFRPHHFLCTIGFQGKGYSPEFVQNYQTIADQLRSPTGGQTLIQVTPYTDAICAPCPHRQGHLCETQEKIERLDQNHAEILQLKEGDQLTWDDAKARIREHMDLPLFHRACAFCSWKSSGICETALMAFLQETVGAASSACPSILGNHGGVPLQSNAEKSDVSQHKN